MLRSISLNRIIAPRKIFIEAASHVISRNTEHRDKKLWTENDSGEKIRIFECYDKHDEAQKVISLASTAVSEGASLTKSQFSGSGTNAQSRVLEDMLRAKGLNYQIYGGLKFYERLEVKDALAYLKLIANPLDDVSFRRIVNVPPEESAPFRLRNLLAKPQALEFLITNYWRPA